MTTLDLWAKTGLGPAGPNGTRLAHRLSPGRPTALGARRNTLTGQLSADELLETPQVARLAGVTQVFFTSDGRSSTRLDHSVEVGQVARHIAEGLGLDAGLAESIGLAHDCGHVPFGHAGEAAVAREVPGFTHSGWGAHLLSRAGHACDVVDGVRGHSWSSRGPRTAEGEVVCWADRICYLTRDFADACGEGLVSLHELDPLVLTMCSASMHEQRDAFVQAVVAGSRRAGVVAMDECYAVALAAFRKQNTRLIYGHPSVRGQYERVSALVTTTLVALGARDSGARASWAARQLSQWDDRKVLSLQGVLPAEVDLARFSGAGSCVAA